MMFHLRFIVFSLLLLAGCGSQPVTAPVDSRSNQSTTRAAAQPRPSPATRKPVSADATYYVVHRGDTLYSIAWQHGLTYRQLADINGIRAPYTIYSGQRLRVKPLAAQRSAAPVQSKTQTTPAVRQPQPVASRKTTAPAS